MVRHKLVFIVAALTAAVSISGFALPSSTSVDSGVYYWGGPGQPAVVPEIRVSSAGYTNGTFVGRRESAYYGIVQVEAIIKGGNIVSIKMLSYPNDNGTSRYISSIAIPALEREAISAQGSHIRMISGASLTSEAFHLSLHSALLQAVN